MFLRICAHCVRFALGSSRNIFAHALPRCRCVWPRQDGCLLRTMFCCRRLRASPHLARLPLSACCHCAYLPQHFGMRFHSLSLYAVYTCAAFLSAPHALHISLSCAQRLALCLYTLHFACLNNYCRFAHFTRRALPRRRFAGSLRHRVLLPFMANVVERRTDGFLWHRRAPLRSRAAARVSCLALPRRACGIALMLYRACLPALCYARAHLLPAPFLHRAAIVGIGRFYRRATAHLWRDNRHANLTRHRWDGMLSAYDNNIYPYIAVQHWCIK